MIFDRAIDRIRGETVTSYEPSLISIDDPSGWNSGASLFNPATQSMKIAAVSACVDIRSDSIGKMPLFVMNSGTKHRERDHYLDHLLTVRPNRLMGPFVFKKLLETWRLMYGNAYVWIARDPKNGTPDELFPLHPDHTEPFVDDNGGLVYVHTLKDGRRRVLKPEEIIHVKCHSDNGIKGQSVLSRASEIIASAGEQQRYEGGFYSRGARPGGVIQVDSNLQREAKNKFRDEWDEIHGGSDNSYRVAILDNGMQYKSFAMTQRDSQFVESREMSVADIARFFLVPLFKLQAGKQTYNSNEANAIEYVKMTLAPCVLQFEEELTYKLLFEKEIKESKRIKANMNAELRGDTASRAAWYKSMRDVGAYNPNEIRAYEDLPEADGGDLRIAPLNSIPLEQMGRYFEHLMEKDKVANQGGKTV